jgi:hypothetical protein
MEWVPDPGRPPDLRAWPYTVAAVAQLVAEGGLDIPAGITCWSWFQHACLLRLVRSGGAAGRDAA